MAQQSQYDPGAEALGFVAFLIAFVLVVVVSVLLAGALQKLLDWLWEEMNRKR